LSRRRLNLGIVAHVDAGKTTLTERLLHAAGIIESVGSVDKGTTQTDSLELERQRGITIKSAVVSFRIGDVGVNLIDTPGHPDFIAEVERALAVLDGVVLVVSAVEGVQPQTRVLMRALQRLSLPTLIFVNKLDRLGADEAAVLAAIRRRLTPSIVVLGTVRRAGSRSVEVSGWQAGKELARRAREGRVHPVLSGSALLGIGIDPLMGALVRLLPAASGRADGRLSGTVFKIERGPAGEKVAYVRLFSGTMRVRERVRVGAAGGGAQVEERITGIRVFDEGSTAARRSLEAGEIGKVTGLRRARIGDAVGEPGPRHQSVTELARPTLTSAVEPLDPRHRSRLAVALSQLAEQDPLIGVRQDDVHGEVSLSLYGEVQREVIGATLEAEYGVPVRWRKVTQLYVERPAGAAKAVEVLKGEGNPFLATIGLSVEPAPEDSGVSFRMAVDPRTTPLFLYKTFENFAEHVETWVRATLHEGLYGWEVTDCAVTMTQCVYSSPDGPPSTYGPLSSPSDFRHLTPIVMMRALVAAGTVVCEPLARVTIELPAELLAGILASLGHAGAAVEGVVSEDELAVVTALLSAERALELRRALPDLTRGEGVIESRAGGYRRVRGEQPRRRRATVDPLDRQAYLASVGRS
jgi:ribosomal protection tetracycline resistance protein